MRAGTGVWLRSPDGVMEGLHDLDLRHDLIELRGKAAGREPGVCQ